MEIISYNILTPSLCHKDEYIDYKEEDLLNRKEKLLKLFEEWVKSKPIILLQEVSMEWKGDFQIFFEERDFRWIDISYGNKYNGFFGVATIIPREIKVKEIKFLHVGELILPAKYVRETGDNIIKNFIEEIISSKEEEYNEIIKQAKNRNNKVIKVVINRNNKDYNIYNYHVPCSFQQPIIQIYHLDVLQRVVSNEEGECIVGGDFNIIPDSIGYKFLTEGYLPKDYEKYLLHKNVMKVESGIKKIMGKEPSFTIHSFTKFGGYFKNTLDYFFITSGINVINGGLKISSEKKLPNNECPSDHLPIFINCT